MGSFIWDDERFGIEEFLWVNFVKYVYSCKMFIFVQSTFGIFSGFEVFLSFSSFSFFDKLFFVLPCLLLISFSTEALCS
jgi:hypothetical protein